MRLNMQITAALHSLSMRKPKTHKMVKIQKLFKIHNNAFWRQKRQLIKQLSTNFPRRQSSSNEIKLARILLEGFVAERAIKRSARLQNVVVGYVNQHDCDADRDDDRDARNHRNQRSLVSSMRHCHTFPFSLNDRKHH